MAANWKQAMWCLYDHVFWGVSRKKTIRRMMACGLTARQAIEEMRTVESV